MKPSRSQKVAVAAGRAWSPKRQGAVVLTVIGLVAFAGLASAQEQPTEEPTEEREDTVFNFGYDEEFHLLVWNTSATDGQYDCTLENGPVNPKYLTEDGLILVDGLTSEVEGEAVDVVFLDREDEAAEPLPYSADGDCALNAAEVAGPNGQINHGMFMKLFNSLREGQRRGCLNRYLAQSHLGKGDQQIKVSDVDPDFVSVMDADTGEIVFSTFAADCERGKSGNGNGKSKKNDNGNGTGDGPEASKEEDGRPTHPASPDRPRDATSSRVRH